MQFPADTTGAFGNDNNASLQVVWWLLAGSTYSGGTLNTSWASSTNTNRVAGQVNVMDDAANNFYLTGVQLEIGDVATPFEHESYGDTLQKCQRYYFQYDGIIYGQDYGGVYTLGSVCNPVTMRAQPTYSAGSNPSSFTLTPSGKSLGWIIQTSANNISNGVTNLAGNAEL